MVRAGTAARIGGFFGAFCANGGHEVLHAQDVLAEFFIDKRCVGEAQKRAVGMRFAQADKVLFAYHRLAARVDVNVSAQLNALVDNGVNIFVRQIQAVAVIGGPAAGAMKVAGAGGIKQNGPGDVALMLLAHFFLLRPCHQVAIDNEVLQELVAELGIQVEDLHDQFIPVVLFGNNFLEGFALGGEDICGCNFVQHVHDVADVFLRIG